MSQWKPGHRALFIKNGTSKGAVMSTQTNPRRGVDGDSSRAADASTRAQDKAQQITGDAQEKAQQAAGQAQAKLREQLDQRSTQLAEQARQQGSDLRAVSEALRDQGKDRPAELINRLAEYAEQAGRYLREKDADAMLGDAEDLGRQKPAAVAASALALGFAASRFLKASSSRRYSARDAQPLPPSSPQTSLTRRADPQTAIEPGPPARTTGPPTSSGM
jgi:gas vesicle protein